MFFCGMLWCSIASFPDSIWALGYVENSLRYIQRLRRTLGTYRGHGMSWSQVHAAAQHHQRCLEDLAFSVHWILGELCSVWLQYIIPNHLISLRTNAVREIPTIEAWKHSPNERCLSNQWPSSPFELSPKLLVNFSHFLHCLHCLHTHHTMPSSIPKVLAKSTKIYNLD